MCDVMYISSIALHQHNEEKQTPKPGCQENTEIRLSPKSLCCTRLKTLTEKKTAVLGLRYSPSKVTRLKQR